MWIDLIVGSASALALGAVLLAAGERIRSLLRIPCPPSLRAAVAWGLGSWWIATAILLLGIAGWFRTGPLVAVIVASGLAGRWSRLRGPAVHLLKYALAGLPLLPVALAPPFFYDAWVYHLGLPWQSLRDGAIHAHAGNLFGAFPPLAQMVYAAPLAVGAFRAPGLIHLFGYCAAAAAVEGMARRLGASRGPATLAGMALLYLPVAPLVPGFPAAEAWTVNGVLAAAGLALTARTGTGSAGAAGWMAGVAAASRLQGLFWVALIAPCILARGRRRPASLGTFAAGAVLGASPWWLKNLLLLGDPLAPLGWSREGIETLWRDAASHVHLAVGLPDLLHRMLEALAGIAWLAVPLALVGLAAAWRGRRPATAALVGMALAGALAWALTGALGRFLAPSLALLLVASACGPRRAGSVVACLAIGLSVVMGVRAGWPLFRQLGGLSVLGEPGQVYAALVVSNPYPAFQACERLPAGSRVLFVAESRGFLFPRRYEAGSQHDSSLLAGLLLNAPSPETVVRSLRALEFTHLFVHVAEMKRLGRDYPVLPWGDAGTRDAFIGLTRHLEPPALLVGEAVVYALPEDPPP